MISRHRMEQSGVCNTSIGPKTLKGPGRRTRRIPPRTWRLFFLVPISYVAGFSPSIPFVLPQNVVQRRPQIRLRDASVDFQEAGLRTLNIADKGKLSSTSPSQTSKFFIPNEQLEQLKESVDLVSVIGSYGMPQFKRSGDNRATCICPFHDDRNPSLSIDGTRGIFKCFSCGAGGNVFNFVREYSKVEGEEMSFYKAVKLVNDKFSNGFSLTLSDGYSGKWSGSQEERDILAAKRERILQANLAAAAFFENSLTTSSTAGPARSHLRSRGLAAQTVRTFAIGFAPESYFTGKQTGPRRWGDGSLVNHLRDKGFTAAEIVDAGLAIRTKKGRQLTEDDNNSTNTTASLDMDYSTLMDRFRGRLVVPIFDATGKEVLGFGGRILESSNEKESDFKAAKYLNSPETLVFKKKNILFGQQMAKKAIRYWDKVEEAPRPVVIVEGYMDSIALWQAGICEAVACMGTALTSEQLLVAARIAGTKNGRIVLCLDNDNAGKNALERICSGGLLSSLADRFPVEIRIAELPEGTKDPAEYIEQNENHKNLEDKFREDVIENSLEWTDWHTKHLISGYDASAARGAPGSFGDVFERLASFLATFTNAAERTKRACELASYLTEIIAKESNTTQVSKTVGIQLESDLVDKASSIADSKAAISGRIASVDGGSNKDIQTKLSNMARGDGLSGIDGSEKLTAKALKKRKGSDLEATNRGRAPSTRPATRPATDARSQRRFRIKGPSPKNVPSLTPHFSGFDFLHENDARWLGLIDDKGKQKNDWLLPQGIANKMGEINELRQKKIVYFNSNDYHGNQFITQEAIDAGYKNEAVARDSGIQEKGVGSLIQINEDSLSISAEDTLLRTLLLFEPARKSMKSTLDTSYASGSEEDIEWSSPEKAWLFSCLVEMQSGIPEHIVGPEDLVELRSYLANRPDAFPGALSPPGFEDSSANKENGAGMSMDDDQPSATTIGDGSTESKTDSAPIDLPAGAFETWSDIEDVEGWASAVDPSVLENGNRPSTTSPESDKASTDTSHEANINGNGEAHNQGNSISSSVTSDVERLATTAVEPRVLNDAECKTLEAGFINAEFVVSETADEKEKPVRHFWGPLDQFFSTAPDVFTAPSSKDSIPREERAELAVQELYSTLVWASAVKKLSLKRKQLSDVASLLLEEDPNDDEGNTTGKLVLEGIDGDKRGQSSEQLVMASNELSFQNKTLSRQELTKYCTSLTAEVRDAAEKVKTVADANLRITRRLMDFALTSGLSEGRISKVDYNQVNANLKRHMAELDKWSVPETEDQNSDEDEPYEDFLERAQMDWGELYEDDRMWTPEDIFGGSRPKEDSDMDHLLSDAGADDETVDDYMARIENDWGWLDEEDAPAEQLTREPYTFKESEWDAFLNGENITISTRQTR